MESVRHWNSDSSALQLAKTLAHAPGMFRYRVKSVGWRAAIAWSAHLAREQLGLEQRPYLTVKSRRAKYPLVARLAGSSDMRVFSQIFHCDEYECIRSIQSPKLIFDLGANVGYSSAYFLSCFPNASILAVEPDPGNYEICHRNLASYGKRAQVVLGAIWSQRARLALSRGDFGDGLEWATQVRKCEGEADEATVDAWDVPSLLQKAGGKQIDLLKVDIERSELELFGDSSSAWLPLVRNICIELHGEDCREVFLNALRDFDYDLGTSGELTIARNLRPKPAV